MIWDFAAAAVLVYAVRTAPWRRLFDNERSNVWWGSIAAVALIWAMRPAAAMGLGLHFLGASILFHMFGARLAFVGVACAGLAAAAAGLTDWSTLGEELLIGAGTAIAVSGLALKAVERWLPPHVFVYIFVAAFAAAGCAALVADTALWSIVAMPLAPRIDFTALVAVATMLAFGEATLTGMLVALFVAYRPGWLSTYDDRRYLRTLP